MILIDANLLLYAYHLRAARHEQSRAWLEAVLSGPDLVRFAWLTLWAFLRIATNPRVFDQPLSSSEAEAAVSSWLAQPIAGILEPGERHWDILRGLVRDGQATGPVVMDAVLAAIALEHGATVCTAILRVFPGSNGQILWPLEIDRTDPARCRSERQIHVSMPISSIIPGANRLRPLTGTYNERI